LERARDARLQWSGTSHSSAFMSVKLASVTAVTSERQLFPAPKGDSRPEAVYLSRESAPETCPSEDATKPMEKRDAYYWFLTACL